METFTDDTVVALASFLAPCDILGLALSCKRFGDKHGTDKKQSAAVREESSREVRQRTDTVSLMEGAARTVLFALATEDERNALPRRGEESWIGLYQEFLKLFHYPLQFEKLAGKYIEYVERSNKTKVCSLAPISGSAICSNIMRAGKHTVSFYVDNTTRSNNGITLGIMRPTTNDITSLTSCYPASDDLSRFSLKDYEILHGNDDNVDCCLFNSCTGHGLIRRRWKKWKASELNAMNDGQRVQAVWQNGCDTSDWEGMERIRETSFKIGMVLDLDEGTLDVYKNDRRLGTMTTGLVGEYCWVVSIARDRDGSDSDVSVTIGR